MLTKILLLSVTLPAGTWAAWTNMHQSHLVMQMVIGIFISLGIFYAVLGMSGYQATSPARAAPEPMPVRRRSRQRAEVRK